MSMYWSTFRMGKQTRTSGPSWEKVIRVKTMMSVTIQSLEAMSVESVSESVVSKARVKMEPIPVRSIQLVVFLKYFLGPRPNIWKHSLTRSKVAYPNIIPTKVHFQPWVTERKLCTD